ncbi:hypothetical protein LIER_23246 [Lithospermum erythrorhizon]|uniref:Uncharacterized protein n=1 Tax=Lithospermum erythrorhizon TaxID=34254 RepID=A0AAV3R0F4_LITER
MNHHQTDAHARRVYYDINDDEEESSHSSSDSEEPNSSEDDVDFDHLHDSEYEMDEDYGFEDAPTKHDRKDSDENMTESLEQNVIDGSYMEPCIEDDLIEVDPIILTGCDVTEDPGTLDSDDKLEFEENRNTRKTKIKSRYKFLEFNLILT